MRNDLTLRKAAQSGVGEVEGTTSGMPQNFGLFDNRAAMRLEPEMG